MGKIFYIMGKSASGKDTIYKQLLAWEGLALVRLVPYTTRPIREGELEGREYHFTTDEGYLALQAAGKVIEARSYHTAVGIWTYFTAADRNLDLSGKDYLSIGTLQSYKKLKEYFGEQAVVPVYIELDDGERLARAIQREREQKEPRYEEMCRRFLADARDFEDERLIEAGIRRRFVNDDLARCTEEIARYIDEEKGL